MDASVRYAVLQDYLGVSDRRIRQLVESGVIIRNSDGTFPLRDSVRAFCDLQRQSATGRGGPGLAGQRERLAREQADSAEMKNAAARRELLPAREVETMWTDICRMLRSRLLAMPGRLQQRLAHLTPHDLLEMDRELRDTLAELADDPL